LHVSNVFIYAGVEIVRDISGGKLRGGVVDSMEIVFHPGKVKCGEYSADTETAG
jgi:RNA 3'-terminal phosphate cyclase